MYVVEVPSGEDSGDFPTADHPSSAGHALGPSRARWHERQPGANGATVPGPRAAPEGPLVAEETLVRRALARVVDSCVGGAEVTEAGGTAEAVDILRRTPH